MASIANVADAEPAFRPACAIRAQVRWYASEHRRSSRAGVAACRPVHRQRVEISRTRAATHALLRACVPVRRARGQRVVVACAAAAAAARHSVRAGGAAQERKRGDRVVSRELVLAFLIRRGAPDSPRGPPLHTPRRAVPSRGIAAPSSRDRPWLCVLGVQNSQFQGIVRLVTSFEPPASATGTTTVAHALSGRPAAPRAMRARGVLRTLPVGA